MRGRAIKQSVVGAMSDRRRSQNFCDDGVQTRESGDESCPQRGPGTKPSPVMAGEQRSQKPETADEIAENRGNNEMFVCI